MFNDHFDRFESEYMLRQMLDSQLKMVPFTFKDLITNQIKFDIKKENYFVPHEILSGKCLLGLSISNP